MRSAPTTRVRPTQPLPTKSVDLADLNRDDVAPVQQVVKFRSPRVPYLGAAVLALAAIAAALLGLGSAVQSGDVPPGVVTVAGTDPATADTVRVDMSKPIPVTVTGMQGDAATLAWQILGTAVGRHEAALVPGANGLATELAAPLNPYLIAGQTTAELNVLQAGNTVATYRFPVQSTQSSFTTALAVGAVVVALFAIAYLESYLRALRRGRSRIVASVGLPVSAALLAVALVAAAWVVLGHQPTLTSVVTCAALGAAAGASAVVGGMRSGQASRYRRRRRARQRAPKSVVRQ